MKLWVFIFISVLNYNSIECTHSDAHSRNSTISIKKNSTIVATATTTTARPSILPNLRSPCSCHEGQCGCCTGVIMDRFNQKACMNVTYEPDDFAFTGVFSFNGRVMYKRTVSGKNPSPMCIRIPRLQFIRLCVQFSNIYFAKRNVHVCIDMEANWEDLTLLEWSFDCLRMGAAGFAVVGEEDGGGVPGGSIDQVDQTDEDYDDSARNAVKYENATKQQHQPQPHWRVHGGGRIVLDNSIALFSGLKPDLKLIQIDRLPNGDVQVKADKHK